MWRNFLRTSHTSYGNEKDENVVDENEETEFESKKAMKN